MTPIYLDNNATTPIAPEVIEVMHEVLAKYFGNPASKTHSFGWHVEELVNIAREQLASLINAKPEEIVFTSGASESNNLAIKGAILSKHPANEIVSTNFEHRSVPNPIAFLQRHNAKAKLLEVSPEGFVGILELEEALSDKTRIVSIMLANNEIGVIQDIAALFAKAKSFETLTHSDATQALGKIEVDVENLNADLLSFSAHKIYGPKGVGALYIKDCPANKSLVPQIHGGGHEFGFRSGTLNVAGIVGFGKACELALSQMKTDTQRIDELTALFIKKLQQNLSGVALIGCPNKRIPGNLSISIEGVDSARLLSRLSTSVALSAGSACQSSDGRPSHVLKALGLSKETQKQTFRVGIGRYNTQSEIELAAEKIIQFAIQHR